MIKKQLETEKDLNVTQEVRGLAARPASARLLEAARQTPQEVFAAYETTPQGQPRPDIMRALFGRNELARKKADSILKRLFKAFINPFTVVLIVLAVISFITDYVIVEPEDRDLTAVLIVGIMVFISGTLRFVQEVRSGNAAERLQAMVKTTIAVLRDGESRERPISELVVGDVIRLAAGDMIPADVRIVETKDLFVSQSSLTGESEPMEKWTAAQPQAGGNPLECNNLAFMGSTVVSGSALALVIAVGKDTLFGALARRVAETRVRTNFEKGVNAVSWVLIRFMVGMVPVVLFLNGFTKGDWVQAALFALSVAVGLTPEMLPMIVSANLAKGAVAMSRKKVIVKHLNAIQNLGAMNILCTDKTGTLTQDRIVLEYPLDVHGNVDERVLRHAFLNSYHQTGLRNLMDEAIVDHAYETNMLPLWQDYRKVDEIPFDFTRRRMSVVVADKAGKTQIITKGAVEEMLSICSYAEYKGNVEPLTSALSEEILATVRRYNEAGLRVIAVAHKTNPMVAGAFSVADESDMVLIGYLAFLDPPKDSAAAAVAALKEYGVAVKVLTGDNDAVTRSVCGQVGLRSHSLLLGSDVEAMDDAALRAAAERTDIFAKLTPQQKARIVTCLRENGHTVGFMGDGINDAAAMKASDVGISVDSAVDIARESADIILLEKDLMVLEQGAIEGRRIYANIIKYIKMTASSNFGNMFSVLAASAFLPFLPLAPLQILVLNLIYDISCTAMPWDNVDADFLKQPKTWDASSISRFMIWFGPASSVFDITTFVLLYTYICPLVFGGAYETLDAGMQVAFVGLFQAGWFVESLWTQTLVLHMLRTPKVPFLRSRASWQVTGLTSLGILAGTCIPFTTVGGALDMMPLPGAFFPWLFATLAAYMLLTTTLKGIFIKKYGELL
ncbi:MAG: magnesium-translocating P-type ATPase [Bilophila wadsworthia]|uniref:magnesium-translocating P-type ATPase n=1 Tax=Bilophila wadsworthia TaxID=35833 RepID=UPI00243240AF|nr:magnesium-translocating P-type ATPase [Bilophila wadsworthia]MCI6541123.1 magnesium-translocating P-type ATPase [Bilophila wadsworthia]